MLFLSDLTFKSTIARIYYAQLAAAAGEGEGAGAGVARQRLRDNLPRCRIQIPVEALHPLEEPLTLDSAPETCDDHLSSPTGACGNISSAPSTGSCGRRLLGAPSGFERNYPCVIVFLCSSARGLVR